MSVDNELKQLIHSIDKRLAVIEERTQFLPQLQQTVYRNSAAIALLLAAATVAIEKLF